MSRQRVIMLGIIKVGLGLAWGLDRNVRGMGVRGVKKQSPCAGTVLKGGNQEHKLGSSEPNLDSSLWSVDFGVQRLPTWYLSDQTCSASAASVYVS